MLCQKRNQSAARLWQLTSVHEPVFMKHCKGFQYRPSHEFDVGAFQSPATANIQKVVVQILQNQGGGAFDIIDHLTNASMITHDPEDFAFKAQEVWWSSFDDHQARIFVTAAWSVEYSRIGQTQGRT